MTLEKERAAWNAYYRAIFGAADTKAEERRLLRMACSAGIGAACEALANRADSRTKTA